MDQNEKYQYNFQYSLANYHSISRQQSQQDNHFTQKDQQTVIRRSNQLIQFKCFININTQQIIKTLLTHYIQFYGVIAARLYRIYQKMNTNIDMSSSSFIRNYQDFIDNQRQKLVQSITELSKVFYNQKQTYFKLISLCVSSSVFKILTLQKQIEDLDFQTVFHKIYWEITGMHSTNQILQKLKTQTFIDTNFQNYLLNKKPTTVYKAQSVTQSLVRNSAQFQNNSFGNSLMSFSIKGQPIKSFNEPPKQRGEISFSKIIKRKQKLNKQNSLISFNDFQKSQILKPNVSNINKLSFNQIQNAQLSKEKEIPSGQKLFNFKKGTGIFFDYSKSKSGKKMPNDFNSNSKILFGTNVLQKKLF